MLLFNYVGGCPRELCSFRYIHIWLLGINKKFYYFRELNHALEFARRFFYYPGFGKHPYFLRRLSGTKCSHWRSVFDRSDSVSPGVTFKLNRGRWYSAVWNEIGFVGKLLQLVLAMRGWAERTMALNANSLASIHTSCLIVLLSAKGSLILCAVSPRVLEMNCYVLLCVYWSRDWLGW